MTVTVETEYDLKSPLFEGELTQVVFRPYWQVAPSIERQEIIRTSRKTSAFFPGTTSKSWRRTARSLPMGV